MLLTQRRHPMEKKARFETFKLHINLVVAIGLSQIWFVIGSFLVNVDLVSFITMIIFDKAYSNIEMHHYYWISRKWRYIMTIYMKLIGWPGTSVMNMSRRKKRYRMSREAVIRQFKMDCTWMHYTQSFLKLLYSMLP